MAIRNSCRNFFIEVVSGLCFGQLSPPEDELVAMLLDIVFTEQGEKGEGEAGGEGEEVRRGTRDLTLTRRKKMRIQSSVHSYYNFSWNMSMCMFMHV